MGYDLKPVIVQGGKKHDPRIPDPLPQLPICMSIVAPRMSGKSSMVCGLIKEVYRKVFDTVILASPSVHFDPTFKELTKFKNVGFIDRVDNETLQDILKKQEEIVKEDPSATLLLYVDDAGDFFRRSSAQKMMNVLYTRARHSGTSLISCVQSPQHLSSIQKTNTTQWIVFRCDKRSMASLAEQLETKHSFAEEVYDYLMDATEKRYSFAYLNFQESMKESIYRYGFA